MSAPGPRTQRGATAPTGARRLGWIDTGDLPMTTYPTTRDIQINRPPLQRAAPAMVLPAAPAASTSTSGGDATAVLSALPKRTPAAPTPRLTVVIMLTSGNASSGYWDRAIREIRRALDVAAASHYETHSCGAEGTRRTSWYAEMSGDKAPELRADLEHFAAYWREWARVTWAPCSPLTL